MMHETNQGESSPAIPLPLLVTGVAGVAGNGVFRYFHDRYPDQVIGIRGEKTWRLVGPGIVALHADDKDGMAKLFEKHKFKSVVNCAGCCALKPCEMDPKMAWQVNVESVESVARQVVDYGARMIDLSIDLVYSGDGEGGYVETDVPDPVSVYGKTMVAGEQVVREMLPDVPVLRISLPMDLSFNGHAGAVDWIEYRYANERPATLYFDEVRTPTFNDCQNELFERLLRDPIPGGIYHAGGPRNLSLYQIAQIINRLGGYDPNLLMGIPRIEAGPIPPRAGNVTMNSEKLTKTLGYAPFDPWPLDDCWVPTDKDWHHDRPSDETRSPDFLFNRLCVNRNRRTDRLRKE